MKANPLLIAAIALALLGGAVWYTRENPPPDDDAAPKLVDLEEDAIRAVTLRRAGQDPIRLERDEDDVWQFGGGLDIPADDSAAGMLVASLASLNADRVVSEKVVDWSPYELDEPPLAVGYELADGEGGGEVRFGRDTPTGSGVFVRLADDPRLYTAYSYNKSSFEKSIYDLRDKRLLRLDEDSIATVVVESRGGAATFEQAAVAFAQADDDWRIVKPLELRADNFTVGDLVRAVRTAEMTEVLAEGEATGEYSFASPAVKVSVTDIYGTHELVIARDEEEDSYYARSSGQPGVFKVGATLAESLDKPVSEFRNKKLFDFGFADPARIEVRAGDLSAAIKHSGDEWLLESGGGRALEGAKVQELLDKLRNLTATDFPSDSEADKAGYGLQAPAIEATVTQEGEGGAETVRVSAHEQALVYAARDGEPSTYQVEQSAAQDIRRALESVLAEPAEQEGEAGQEDEESPSES